MPLQAMRGGGGPICKIHNLYKLILIVLSSQVKIIRKIMRYQGYFFFKLIWVQGWKNDHALF